MGKKRRGHQKSVMRRLWSKFCVLLVVVIMGCQLVVPAEAQTLVQIQVSLDLTTWEVLASVVRNNTGFTALTPELRRMGEDALEKLASDTDMNNSIDIINGLQGAIDTYDTEGQRTLPMGASAGFIVGGIGGMISDEKNRVLTFPGNTGDGYNSTTADMNQAMEVHNALVFGMNQAFGMYLEANHINRTTKLGDFKTAMVEFLEYVQDNSSGNTLSMTDPVSHKTMTFTWRVPKGYVGAGKLDSLNGGSEDAEYVHWGHLAAEAFTNYLLEKDEAVTEENVYSSVPGQLEKALVGVFSSMLDGLRGILGLWSMDELMFNTGFRGAGYVGGIFPANWEPTIWALFLFAEIFAAMVLLYGTINNVLKKALATTNSIARMRAMEQVQNILLCAIALAILPVVLRILISMASSFTEMIYAMVPYQDGSISATGTGEKREIADMVARYSSGGGTLGGIIAQFLYFGVQVYFNFFYALRALTTALLIIMAPIMISLMSVSEARKQTTIAWAKELMVNICIQPIQAFVMTVILLLPTSSHGFDNMVAIYALIPFTSLIKGFFFGDAGRLTDAMAATGKRTVTGAAAGAGLAFGSAALGGIISAAGTAKDKVGGSTGAADREGAGVAPAIKNGGPKGKDTLGGIAAGKAAGKQPQGQSFVGDADGKVKEAPGLGSVLESNDVAEGKSRGSIGKFMPAKVAAAVGAAGPALKSVGTKVMDGAKAMPGKVVDGMKAAPKKALDAAKETTEKAGKALDTGTAVGGAVIKGSPRILAGAAIAGLGGAMSSIGNHTGAQMVNLGTGIAGYHRKGEISQGETAEEGADMEELNQEQPQVSNDGSFVQKGQDYGSYFREGKEFTQREIVGDDLKRTMGIEDISVSPDGENIACILNKDSAHGQEAMQYAEMLKNMSPGARAAEVARTGVSASVNERGQIVETVNRQQWSAANGGATITTVRGNSGLRIETPVAQNGTTHVTSPRMTPRVPTKIPFNNEVQIRTATPQTEQVHMPKQQSREQARTVVGEQQRENHSGVTDASSANKVEAQVTVKPIGMAPEHQRALEQHAERGLIERVDGDSYRMQESIRELIFGEGQIDPGAYGRAISNARVPLAPKEYDHEATATPSSPEVTTASQDTLNEQMCEFTNELSQL